jgi:hypothetical protein
MKCAPPGAKLYGTPGVSSTVVSGRMRVTPPSSVLACISTLVATGVVAPTNTSARGERTFMYTAATVAVGGVAGPHAPLTVGEFVPG